jgi:hypothetical protein
MRKATVEGRCAERTLRGVDDAGVEERVVIWIERRPGAVWGVGRAVNPQHRRTSVPRPDEWVFEGYELNDALQAANDVLEDDVRVLEQDGSVERVKPFTRAEVLPILERFFFGRR